MYNKLNYYSKDKNLIVNIIQNNFRLKWLLPIFLSRVLLYIYYILVPALIQLVGLTPFPQTVDVRQAVGRKNSNQNYHTTVY